MTNESARDILQALMDGVDPATGESLEQNHLCNQPCVIRALHAAILGLMEPDKVCDSVRNRFARSILQMIIDGVDPGTGEILKEDHLCAQPDVLRALHAAVLALTGQTIAAAGRPDRLQSAGRPWTEEEEKQLQALCQDGKDIAEISERLGRRRSAIRKRMKLLGLLEPSPVREPKPGLERAGKPWWPEEDERLRELYEAEWSIEQMAAEMRRTTYSIFCHMERLGLYGDAPGYPQKESVSPWSRQDGEELRRMHREGAPLAELAAHFGRSEKAIAARMFAMGLTKEWPLSPLRGQKEE